MSPTVTILDQLDCDISVAYPRTRPGPQLVRPVPERGERTRHRRGGERPQSPARPAVRRPAVAGAQAVRPLRFFW